ncbi:MAG: hypothetical protein V2A76_03150 [Planctomycetota bacterium]
MRAPVTDLLKAAVRQFALFPPFQSYVDPERILVVASRGRAGLSGKRAACHFTRFPDSRGRVSADGRWEFPRIRCGGREIRYVISFVLPRFLFLSVEEQAEDIVHELLHIHPDFSGVPSPRRHGREYDALARGIARSALASGVQMPPLPADGEQVLFHRMRPFPHPFRRSDGEARRDFDESDLELAGLKIDPKDRQPPPARYLYECPECGEQYRRQRPLRTASCGSCAGNYDGRFKLRLVRS